MGRRVEPLDDLVADPLVLGVVRGDRAAWFQLTLYIEHWVSVQVPNHWRMRKARLSHSEDDVRDVLLEVLERVGDDDFRPLRQYLERKMQAVPDVRATSDDAPQVTFASWLAGLVDYAIRDHVRKRYGRAPAPRASEAPPDSDQPPEAEKTPSLTKRDMHSWAVHPAASSSSGEFGGGNPAVTGMLTAHAILRYAAETFDERELGVFRRYLEQASFDELSEEFQLGGKQAAEAEIRRLKERLRSRFRAS
jgi:hypothetical protein